MFKADKTQTKESALRCLMGRFRKDEDGGIIIFSLFMFVLILWFGGMAIDLMRFETTRAKLQGTLDRATLAAADLDQTLAPDAVVEDYFEKAGMLAFLQDTEINEGINFRIVTANAEAQMPLMFADIPRVLIKPFDPNYEPSWSSLTVSGASTAEERVTDVEVSLVLDVSGSMNSGGRIGNLRPAARDFVTTVLQNNTNAPQGLITISMVPYSAVVNPGTDIIPHLNINRSHSHSTCPLFSSDSFYNTTVLNMATEYDHVSHFDPDWYWNSRYYNPINYPWCHEGDHNAIIPLTTDEGVLHEAIDDLTPYGNTAIDLGMKWGLGLLDPSTRTLITQLAGRSDTDVPGIAAGRPYEFGMPDVLKVVVLMTDGSNTNQYDLKEPYKTGFSNIYFHRQYDDQPLVDVPTNRFSVQYQGESTPTNYWDDRFYWNGYGYWDRMGNKYPIGFSSQWDYVSQRQAGESAILAPGEGQTYLNRVHHARWQELYAEMVYNRVNNTWLSRAYNHGAISWNEYAGPDNAIDYWVASNNTANNRLSSICAAARAQGVIIYTVAFEAPSGGQAALQDCASSPSHYFDVDGTDISAAFSAIASDIRALKLTQ